MDVMGKAERGRTNLVGAALLGALVLGTAVLAAAAPGDSDRRTRGGAAPKTFFAVRRVGAVVGELGGSGTAWAGDFHRLAVEISGADVTVVNIIDTRTGQTTDLQSVDQPAIKYRVIAPAYRIHGINDVFAVAW